MIFRSTSEVLFSLWLKLLRLCLFSGVWLLEISKITVWERYFFNKKKFYGGFEIVSTLCEKLFSKAPVKCFSLNGSHYSDSLVFRNAAFGEIKYHILKKTAFSNKFYWSFRYMSVLHKKVFSRAPVKWFSLCGSYNSGSVFPGILLLERSRTTIWKRHIYKKKKKKMLFEVLCMCLPYTKAYFQEHQWSAFLFIAQMT